MPMVWLVKVHRDSTKTPFSTMSDCHDCVKAHGFKGLSQPSASVHWGTADAAWCVVCWSWKWGSRMIFSLIWIYCVTVPCKFDLFTEVTGLCCIYTHFRLLLLDFFPFNCHCSFHADVFSSVRAKKSETFRNFSVLQYPLWNVDWLVAPEVVHIFL